MADFDFKNLGTRSFEHLIQTLAIKYIGAGVTIFGDGPDGGREATYTGRSHYPSASGAWEGYIVLQAKFLQRPTDAAPDAAWLCAQLRAELDKFADKSRGLDPPQYYIIATNVRLSSFTPRRTKRGKVSLSGRDAVHAVFEEYRTTLGLKGFDIWDYDKLRGFLEDSDDIRGSYAAWITSSDVLMSLMNSVHGYRADFEDTMWRLLSGDLRRSQYSKLQQAGHDGEGAVQLSSVFIDLPISSTFDDRESGEELLAVQFLLEQSDIRHDPKSIHDRRMERAQRGLPESLPGNRFLILGGPGQGKSTITQFVSQILRARWLVGQPEYRFAEGSYAILRNVISCAERENICFPGVARFPVRIDLPQYADEVQATNNTTSIFDYI